MLEHPARELVGAAAVALFGVRLLSAGADDAAILGAWGLVVHGVRDGWCCFAHVHLPLMPWPS